MSRPVVTGQERFGRSALKLLPADRTILERDVMEYCPFGLDERGHTIRDLSGMSIRAIVLYLERPIAEKSGEREGRDAVRGCAIY